MGVFGVGELGGLEFRKVAWVKVPLEGAGAPVRCDVVSTIEDLLTSLTVGPSRKQYN